MLPVAVADQGIVGCTTKVLLEHGNKFYELNRLSYTQRKLTRLDSNAGTEEFSWQDDVPQLDGKRERGRISWTIVGTSSVDVDAAGLPLRVWNETKGKLESNGEFVWRDGKLQQIQWHNVTAADRREPGIRSELIYDCKGLPRVRKAVNAGGRLGI